MSKLSGIGKKIGIETLNTTAQIGGTKKIAKGAGVIKFAETSKLTPLDEIKKGGPAMPTGDRSSKCASLQNDSQLQALRQEKVQEQQKLNTAQEKYNNITQSKTKELSEAKEEVNTKRLAYLEAVDGSKDPEVVKLRDEIQETENEYSSTQDHISECNVNIQQKTTEIADVEGRINNVDTHISAIEGKLSALKGELSSAEDDKKDSINAQIDAYSKKLGEEKAEKTKLESIKESLTNKKKAFEEEKKKAELNLEILKAKKAELNEKLKKTSDEKVKKAMEEYNKADEKYQGLVQKAESEKASALTEVESARSAISKIDGQIAVREAELIQQQIEEEMKKAKEEAAAQAAQAAQAAAAGGAGGAGGSGDAAGGSGDASGASSTDSQAAENVEVEKLKNNVNQAKQELASKETELFNVYKGKNETLNKLKKTRDENFEAFCDALSSGGDKSLAKEIKNAKKDVDKLEDNLNSKDLAIAQLQQKIDVASSSKVLITNKISGLESAKASLGKTDQSKLQGDASSQYAKTVSDLNRELESLKKEQQRTEAIIKDNQELKKLKDERDKIKKEYDNANQTLDSKMQEAVKKHPEISGLSSALTKYTDSKKEYDTKFSSTVTNLNSEITTAKTKVNSLTQTLGVAEGKQLGNKYSYTQSSGSGGSIVENARKYIGKRESDGSADIFWKKVGMNWSSRSMPWCAAFVSSILLESGVNMQGAYKNSVAGLRAWGQKNGKYISGANANGKVKPGDVVIWKGGYFSSHTGIVSKVYPDGTYDTIEGNFGNKVSDNHGNGRTGKYQMARTTGFVSI